jgi:hypothetical protein
MVRVTSGIAASGIPRVLAESADPACRLDAPLVEAAARVAH